MLAVNSDFHHTDAAKAHSTAEDETLREMQPRTHPWLTSYVLSLTLAATTVLPAHPSMHAAGDAPATLMCLHRLSAAVRCEQDGEQDLGTCSASGHHLTPVLCDPQQAYGQTSTEDMRTPPPMGKPGQTTASSNRAQTEMSARGPLQTVSYSCTMQPSYIHSPCPWLGSLSRN